MPVGQKDNKMATSGAPQIGHADIIEQRSRRRFADALDPWQVTDFDGKYPALDGIVQVCEAVEGKTASSANVQPLVFFVQHKSITSNSRHGKKVIDQIKVHGFKVRDLKLWWELPVPVMLTVYRPDPDETLYCWAHELRNEFVKRVAEASQETLGIPFDTIRKLSTGEKTRISEAVKTFHDQWCSNRLCLATPRISPESNSAEYKAANSIAPSTPLALVPGDRSLVLFCDKGFRDARAEERFRFAPLFEGSDSAFILSAFADEAVGLNLRANVGNGTAEIRKRHAEHLLGA